MIYFAPSPFLSSEFENKNPIPVPGKRPENYDFSTSTLCKAKKLPIRQILLQIKAFRVALLLAHRGNVDHKFLDPVYSQRIIHGFIHVGTDHAGSRANGFRSQMHILSRMPSVKI